MEAAKASGHAADAARLIDVLVHDPKTPSNDRIELYRQVVDLHGCLGSLAAVANDNREELHVPHNKEDPYFRAP